MRCLSCDKILTDYEATRKHAETGEYLDLCGYCFRQVVEVQPFRVIVNPGNFHNEVEEDDGSDEL